MEKEQWKDDILRSLDGIKRAEPGPGLYAGIRAKLNAPAAAGPFKVVHRAYLALAAACLALLITANVWALRQEQTSTSGTSVYQLDTTRFDVYQPDGS